MIPTAAERAETRNSRFGPPLPPLPMLGLGVAVLAIVLIGWFNWKALAARTAAVMELNRSQDIEQRLQGTLALLKDAETGQRGFLLTGDEEYLDVFVGARTGLAAHQRELRRLVAGQRPYQAELDTLAQQVGVKLEEIDQTIALQRDNRTAEALAVVRSDRGKLVMDQVRALIDRLQQQEAGQRELFQSSWQRAGTQSTMVTWAGSAALLLVLGLVAILLARDHRARELQAWMRSSQAAFGARILGDLNLDQLGERTLAFLAERVQARVGALYLARADGRFQRVATYALPPDAGSTELRPGDGLLGQVAKDQAMLHVRELPPDYLPVGSSLGRGRPRELLLAPAAVDGVVQGVIELGFLHSVAAPERELVERIAGGLGIAVRSARDRSRLEELLEETQRQAEELQTQQEELRVSNEELEEQGRILRESQQQLEIQQVELEQANAQLEEQSSALEMQRDELAQAQRVLTDKAIELQRSSRYKSEFLANMSHELRTPLNSSLILAKLLADNKPGNLSEEQVRYAQTISAAGNDLLALINDILDLARIEAGKMELHPQPVVVATLVESLLAGLRPVAQEKRLQLHASLQPGIPQRIETDPQRLAQILRNLLANALKFTAQGEVALEVSAHGGGLAFAVRDTGIGIDPSQQQAIFEAFRQADGSTQRKYGGSGLGLSISRDLARLLGGDLAVQSTPGQGSTFTLVLPLAPPLPTALADVPLPAATPPRLPPPAVRPSAAAAVAAPRPPPDDDRDRLSPDARLILVIEDDQRFAAILRDLAHELGFQCVLAHSANDGLAAASTWKPSAIVLDMNLPDHSGLGVLDQLKRNPATRHIPVHVVSVADHAREALELGAVGYALKPVLRDDLIEAFRLMEAKFSQSLRRVLVVEDDPRQREAIRELLAGPDVQISTVADATAALAELRQHTWDCMVMDLNLPDLSGYELLEQMAAHDGVPFPPVIVYTGRALSRDEEQRLRRFTHSIIIKDARSPERLLDEVTLFLHQVEAQLPAERQRMLREARDRDSTLAGRRILVVEDDVRNIYALTSVLEPQGAKIQIARNGREALAALAATSKPGVAPIELVLMDIMMPEMDGLTAMREIRSQPAWSKLPIIALTAKAMRDDQEQCLAAGANDYIAKPLDVDRLLSLVRVWLPK